MKIQVNSDKTIAVDARVIRFVQGEAGHELRRFAGKLTRVEIHLSDVDSRKTGQADKRCLIEVRPAGARPLAVDAKATTVSVAIHAALTKMQRRLDTFFGRRGRTAVSSALASTTRKRKAPARRKTLRPAGKRAARKTALIKPPAEFSPRGPKKKGIYQARRKPWPARYSDGLKTG
jgi:Sigma 54 modulation protein / S30EA ribosomal protein